MNWGIIGLGHMAKNFASSIKELDNTKLIGASSRSFLKLIKYGYKNKIRFKYLYRKYDEILSCKEINNIYIGTLNNTHHDFIIKCVEAGKNILCEKPFVINSNEAENIRKKLNNSNIFFLEAIAYRTHPQTEQVMKLLKENIIGKITNIKSNFGFDAGTPKKNSRIFNNQLGGGSILDLGCYPITFSNLIANYNNKEKEIVPKLKDVSGEIHNFGVDLSAKAKLVYDNSIISEVEVSINKGLSNVTEIFGVNGSIKILDPWLPKKNNIIEIHKNNKIKKIVSSSELSLFANQINFFNIYAKNKKYKDNHNAMSIDNSVNYVKVMSEWKSLLFKNENY